MRIDRDEPVQGVVIELGRHDPGRAVSGVEPWNRLRRSRAGTGAERQCARDEGIADAPARMSDFHARYSESHHLAGAIRSLVRRSVRDLSPGLRLIHPGVVCVHGGHERAPTNDPVTRARGECTARSRSERKRCRQDQWQAGRPEPLLCHGMSPS